MVVYREVIDGDIFAALIKAGSAVAPGLFVRVPVRQAGPDPAPGDRQRGRRRYR